VRRAELLALAAFLIIMIGGMLMIGAVNGW
jgi:hypothetical protein